jgi:23S rRNA pseudouridine2605 synthase
MERLSRYLSRCGVASRRKAEAIISEGRVTVNGVKMSIPQHPVNAETDTIMVDGLPIIRKTRHTYVALYKPTGCMSDLADDRGRPLARDLITVAGVLFPVGRLDYNSEGLIFFTDDGDFANLVMHPRYGMEKEYLMKVKGLLSGTEMAALKKGFAIEGVLHKVKDIKQLRSAVSNTWYSVIVAEGKNRMIRKLGDRIGHPVLKLKRVRIGNVELGYLKPGEFRYLTEREVNGLRRYGPTNQGDNS